MDFQKQIEKYKRLADACTMGIVIHKDGMFIDGNQAFFKISGYSEDELKDISLLNLIRSDYKHIAIYNMQNNIETEYEVVGVNKIGKQFPALLSVSNEWSKDKKEILYRIVRITDLTKYKERKAEHKTKELQLINILNELKDGVISIDWQTKRILHINKAAIEMLQISLDKIEISFNDCINYFHPDDKQKIEKFITNPSTKETQEAQFRIFSEKKGIIWVLLKYKFIKNNLAQITRVDIILTDITQLISQEEEIKKSQLFYKFLFEDAHDIYTILDKNLYISFLNPGIKRILGYAKTTSLHIDKLLASVHPEDYELVVNTLKKLKSILNKKETITFRFKNNKGSWIYLEATGHNLLHHDVINGITIVFRDVTPKIAYEKKLEEALAEMEFANFELKYVNQQYLAEIEERQKIENELKFQKSLLNELNENLESQIAIELEKNREKDRLMMFQSRQAAMGEMIGNIAHQWRQPLNALSLMIYQLIETYNKNEISKENIVKKHNEIKGLIAYMSQTIDDFRKFFKPEQNKEEFSLLKMTEKACFLMKAHLEQYDISLNIHCENDIILKGFPNQFAQVLMNIIANAKDALMETDKTNKFINIEIYPLENQAIINIFNNGIPIPNDIIDKIFDPYFTTKEEGKGTGIGLYMAKTIVEKNMHGKIEFVNSPEGVLFCIKLPMIN